MKSGCKPSHSAPASTPFWKIKQPREIDIPNASNGCTPQMNKDCLVLWPVSRFYSGEGLPYAPINWPSQGDNWSWKVGGQVDGSGHHINRYLCPPINLQDPKRPKRRFDSKKSLVRYIQTEFPGADVNAFFGSFSWKIPALERDSKKGSYGEKRKKICSKVKSAPHPLNVPHRMRGEKDKDQEWKEEEESTRTCSRKRQQKSAPAPSRLRQGTRQSFKRYRPFTDKHEVITIDLTEETEASDSLTKDTTSASDFENDELVSRKQNYVSSVRRSFGTRHSHVACKESAMGASWEPPCEKVSVDCDYTTYLKSLLQDPSSQDFENEMVEARMKLSSLLAMDFSLLISPDNLTELENLLSKLQKDSSLTLDQSFKLQMLEEIPLAAKHFLDTRKHIEAADNFLFDLEINIGKVISLQNKYNQFKKSVAEHQAEIDSNLSAMQELEYQILQLQSRHAKLADVVATKRVDKNKLVSDQGRAMDSISSMVQKVELGKSEKHEWELKKANAAKRVADILAKYEYLKGFSL